MAGEAPRRSAWRLSGTRHGFPRRHGGAWEIRPALSTLRRQGAAHPLRRQRDELLPAMPDRRKAARRPRSFPPAARGLAADTRGTGSAAPSCLLTLPQRWTEPSTIYDRGVE